MKTIEILLLSVLMILKINLMDFSLNFKEAILIIIEFKIKFQFSKLKSPETITKSIF